MVFSIPVLAARPAMRTGLNQLDTFVLRVRRQVDGAGASDAAIEVVGDFRLAHLVVIVPDVDVVDTSARCASCRDLRYMTGGLVGGGVS